MIQGRKERQLAADHRRGWHKENSFASAGCPLCQKQRDCEQRPEMDYGKRPEDELLKREAQEGKRRVESKLEELEK